MMTHDDEQRDGQAGYDVSSGISEKKQEHRGHRSGDQRSQGNDAAQRKRSEEEEECEQDCLRRQAEKHPEASGDALAAGEAEKGGKKVPQQRRDGSARQGRFSQVQEAHEQDRYKTFGGIAYQGEEPCLFPGAACDVGGADIAAADLADFYPEPSGDEHAGGNGPT